MSTGIKFTALVVIAILSAMAIVGFGLSWLWLGLVLFVFVVVSLVIARLSKPTESDGDKSPDTGRAPATTNVKKSERTASSVLKSVSDGLVRVLTFLMWLGVVLLVLAILWWLISLWWNWDESNTTTRQSATANGVVLQPPSGGTRTAPSSQSSVFSRPVKVPIGWRLCGRAANGSGSYRWQFHPAGTSQATWLDGPSSRSEQLDQVRYRSKGAAQTITFTFVPVGENCS